MPIAAANPTDRVEQLVILTEKLTDLIEREIDALSTRRPADITEFEEERNRLASIYNLEMSLIRQDRSMIEGISAKLKSTLSAATEKFQTKLAEHEKILNRIQQVSEKMIRSIAEEITAKRAPTVKYGQNAAADPRALKQTAPLTLNQVI